MRTGVERLARQAGATAAQGGQRFGAGLAVEFVTEEEGIGAGRRCDAAADGDQVVAAAVPGRAVKIAGPDTGGSRGRALQVIPGAAAVLQVGVPKPCPLVAGRVQEQAVARARRIEVAARAHDRRGANHGGGQRQRGGLVILVDRRDVPAARRQAGTADRQRFIAAGAHAR